MEDGDNPFVLLGLDAAKGELYPQDSSYSKEEIQAAWKKLIIKNHPDRVKPKTPANIRRATRLSCKLNAARDLLFDLAEYRKWKEESEDPSYQENHDGGYPQYEKSDMPRRPRRPRATTPGRSDLGNPYEGNMPMSGFSFDGDGSKGHEAPDGIPGRNGQRYGQHGTDGTAARAAGGGQDGKDLRIEIKVWLHEDGGFFFVSADATTGTDILDPDADRLRMMPLKAFEKVDWTAKGGHGGRGGHGGQGGKGHRGRNGANATKSRYGQSLCTSVESIFQRHILTFLLLYLLFIIR
jgi:curved DNA-binding protein CbpA